MLPPKTIPKWLLYILVVGLLLAVVFTNELAAKDRTLIKDLDSKIQQLNNKIDKLKKEVKTIQTSKATPAVKKAATPKPQIKPAVYYPIGCEQYKPTVAKYGWNVSIALSVAFAESGCNPNAVSRTNDHGLFQINNGLALYGSKIYDPVFNTSIAYNVKYKASGWYPWTVCTKGIVRCW